MINWLINFHLSELAWKCEIREIEIEFNLGKTQEFLY